MRFLLFTSLIALAACKATQAPAPVVSYGKFEGAGSAGIHTVLEGDTVYTISEHYKLPLRDIITVNSISAPYKLQTGYRLRLPPPNEYKVKDNDTISSIAQLFDVSPHEITQLNDLRAPFKLEKAQVLRIPTPAPKAPHFMEVAASSGNPSFIESAPLDSATVESVDIAPRPGAVEVEALPPGPDGVPAVEASPLGSARPKVQPVSAQSVIPDPVPARAPGGKFMRPVEGRVISGFGPKKDGLHNDGINFQVPKGTPVRAADNGEVVFASDELAGYGNLVLVRHADKWMTAYAHLDRMLVKKGEIVRQGQTLGTAGSTGQVDKPQLHFEIRQGTKAIDPERYL